MKKVSILKIAYIEDRINLNSSQKIPSSNYKNKQTKVIKK